MDDGEMKYRIIAFFFLFILVFSPVPSHALSSTTWLINPDKIPSFGVDEQKKLAEGLARANIRVVYDPSLKMERSSSLPSHTPFLTPLIQGKHVCVYLITPSLEKLHVGLVVKDMLTLKGEALQEFRRTLQDVVHCFQTLGYGDYLAFCNFGKTYTLASGEALKGQCWEMIPLGKGYVSNKNGVYELAPKIWRNNYVLFNQAPNFKENNPILTAQFAKLLHARSTHGTPCSLSFCKETLPWKLHITDVELTKEATIKRIFMALQTIGAVKAICSSDPTLVKDEGAQVHTHESEFNINSTQERATCAFCNKTILKKQEMLSGNHITILYNYIPYTKDAHFLILPFQHTENLHCLTKDQFAEAIQGAQNISFILEDTQDLVWFCQNGPRAGQTTPHTHLHVLKRPDPVGFPIKILNDLIGNTTKPVEEKDYQRNRKRLLRGVGPVLTTAR